MSKGKILIVGCGDLGIATARRLQSLGHRVFGARRSISNLPDDVPGIVVDLSEVETLTAIQEQSWDVVIVTLTADEFSAKSYRDIYVEGLRHLLGALSHRKSLAGTGTRCSKKLQGDRNTVIGESGRKPFIIFTSSISVYGQQDHSWVDEHSETIPTSFSGQVMLEAEQLLLSSGFDSCVIRFGGIYQRKSKGLLIEQLLQGYICPREPAMYSNRITAVDCSRILTHLVAKYQNGTVLQTCYIGVDCAPTTLREVMEWLAVQYRISLDQLIERELPCRGGSKRCSNKGLLELGFEFDSPDYRSGFSNFIESYYRGAFQVTY